ncbi:MAG: four helix bundle protein [Terrimicrobiaceae bacterium]|nr:four helix bundle protein [Terrimicrobiaceae bacterium]
MQKLTAAYLLWHDFLNQLPRLTRYSLGAKIDSLFTETLELVLSARYASKDGKLTLINKAVVKFDALKFFLQILWQSKALDNKKYLRLSEALAEIGKIMGGWKKLF